MKRKQMRMIVGGLLLVLLGAREACAQRAGRPTQSGPGIISNVRWSDDGGSVRFTSEGQRFEFDLKTMERRELESPDQGGAPDGSADPSDGARAAGRPRRGNPSSLLGTFVGRPSRGRQYTQVDSPDGRWEAHFENWNVVLKSKDSDEVIQVTTDGNEHVHYGTASWVYGEELGQTQAMWWKPDSSKVLYYKFDDSKVQPFYLIRGWSEVNTSLYPEYYAKAGAPNPIAELYVFDLETRQPTRVDIGGGGDEYIYGIRSSPDGQVILLNWTDRLQQHLRVLAVDLETGSCRTVVEERQPTWQSNSPPMVFLKDNHRFIWPTDKTGYTHYELRDLDGKLHCTLTQGDFQCSGLTLYEDDQWIDYQANSSPQNPYYTQFHLGKLDGTEHRRVTTQELHHSNFSLSPDRQWLIAQCEAVNTPPCTVLYRTDGTLAAQLATSDPATAANLAEEFHFRSSDDRFDIYGILYKPRDFDPAKSYPVINSVYGGPGSIEYRPNYVSSPRPECERGYLVVKVNNRGTGGRSKDFLGAAYLRLGDVDIQDHADAIRHLSQRPYFDKTRVGIVGHSYGGFMAAMGIFKHPDVYAAAVDRAGPTDWRNYDTIYTERYMSTPQLNSQGYTTGAAMTYVPDFRGKLLIMHGMVDDNVHPNNAFQLIAALDKAGKPYESRFWPEGGHGLGPGAETTQNEFFDRVLKPGN